jgi:hypothetical protein
MFEYWRVNRKWMLETRERPMKDPFIDVLDVFP